MATSTDVPIYTTTLASDVPSITIDLSAYQMYKNIKIIDNARNSNGDTHLMMRFNSDTAGNYSGNWMFGSGASASAGRGNNLSSIYVSRANATSGVGRTVIFNYSDTTMYKTVLSRGDNSDYTFAWTGTWRNTAAVTSVTIASSNGNLLTGSTFSVYGIGSASTGAKATGGAIYSDANYMYHVFTSTGAFTPSQALTADLLVVAGGGAGGIGGGGAGGLLALSSQSLASGTAYICTIGAGGAAQTNNVTTASMGVNSSFIGGAVSQTAIGGGAGNLNQNGGITYSLTCGGSGGGGGAVSSSGGTTTGGTGTAGQGYAGGGSTFYGSPYVGAGGGGAGAAGQSAVNMSTPGNGGVGATSTLINAIGTATGAGETVSGVTYFAGGGGGGGNGTTVFGVGGYGGGATASNVPVAGAKINTGGGGGGYNGGVNAGGNGGSGIVIVRYAK